MVKVMEKESRLDYLDLLKVIAILMVISQHIPLYDFDFINNGKILEYFFKLLSEGVPLFVTINGFLLFRKDNLDVKKHYKKTLKMFVLVLIWEAILIPIGMLLSGTKFNAGLMLDLFFRTGGDNAVYTSHLWFMQQLIAVYCVYPLLWKEYKNDYSTFKLLFALITIFSVGVGTIELISNLFSYSGYANMVLYVSNYIKQYSFLGECSWQFFYFCLGGVLYKNINKIKEKRILAIIIGILSWILAFVYGYYVSIQKGYTFNGYFNRDSLFMVFTIIGWFALTMNYKGNGLFGKIINSIGKNTFGIYVIHNFMVEVFKLIIPTYCILFRLLSLLCIFISTYLVTLIIKKTPKLKNILSF